MKLKTCLYLAMLIALTQAANAADLPSRRAPPVFVPPPVPAFTWTGLYVGLHAGYAFGRENAVYSVLGVPVLGVGISPKGIIGGGHAGYNFSTQSLPVFGGVFGGGGVVGIEGDVDGSDYKAGFGGLLPLASSRVRTDIQGSIRGRLGIAVDRILFYATGGAAFATFKNTTATFIGTDFATHNRVGYTVGGGVEYAFTPQWTARVEYRYSDYGRFGEALPNSTLGLATVSRRETQQRVIGGISYLFATPVAPVVARY